MSPVTILLLSVVNPINIISFTFEFETNQKQTKIKNNFKKGKIQAVFLFKNASFRTFVPY